MKSRCSRTKGFTLVELLVVIGIIAILMAILFPVFNSVREKARQAKCQANLHQIAVALKEYRSDHGRYPGAPYFDTTDLRYKGGLSALYPDYIKEKDLLICPDDRQIRGVEQQAKDYVYSSYNGWVNAPGAAAATWVFQDVDATRPDTNAPITGPRRTYNYYGFSEEGWDVFSDAVHPYPTTLPPWLRDERLRWRHYPALWNKTAPDNTIICHCTHHRSHFKSDTAKMDAVVTLGGSAKMVNISQMGDHDSDDVADVSLWVSQSD